MKKLGIMLSFILLLSMMSAILLLLFQGKKNPVLTASEIKSSEITLIQASLSYNDNPNGINEAKFINGKKEIQKWLKAFKNSSIGEETESVYGNCSLFRFFADDRLIKELRFYNIKASSIFLIQDNRCFTSTFYGDSPWTLYKESESPVLFVDKNFNTP